MWRTRFLPEKPMLVAEPQSAWESCVENLCPELLDVPNLMQNVYSKSDYKRPFEE